MDFLQDSHFWLVISFAIFAVIVWKAGKGKLITMLDERIKTIREELKAAENLRVEAQELLAQYQRKSRDAERDADRIVQGAEKNAEEIRRQAEKDLDATMALREKQLTERLDRLKQNAKDEIREYAANLAMAATAEIIAGKLDKAANDRLVEQTIKNIDKNFG